MFKIDIGRKFSKFSGSPFFLYKSVIIVFSYKTFTLMKLNKSPGSDGLTVELYIQFRDDIKTS